MLTAEAGPPASATQPRCDDESGSFDFFDDIVCLCSPAEASRWAVMQKRFACLGIAGRVRRHAAVGTPGDTRVGRALAHRRLLQDAAERGLRSLLVVEDETLFLDRTPGILAAACAELRATSWALLYLGTWRGTDHLAPAPACAHLCQAGGRTAPFAVAYAEVAFAPLLAALPTGTAAMIEHLGKDGSIETALATLDARAFVVHPAVATVPHFLPYQAPADQARFTP